MKAVEIKSKTDKKGHLRINYQSGKSDRKVRVLILFEEDNSDEEENQWLRSISDNPAFDFLNEPEEDVYTSDDGKPLND